jgi:hypothetical protein
MYLEGASGYARRALSFWRYLSVRPKMDCHFGLFSGYGGCHNSRTAGQTGRRTVLNSSACCHYS